jgi:hypothetical protein
MANPNPICAKLIREAPTAQMKNYEQITMDLSELIQKHSLIKARSLSTKTGKPFNAFCMTTAATRWT